MFHQFSFQVHNSLFSSHKLTFFILDFQSNENAVFFSILEDNNFCRLSFSISLIRNKNLSWVSFYQNEMNKIQL